MHHFVLVLLHNRHLVYLCCSILFILGALSLGFQPYFSAIFARTFSLGIMISAVVMGLSYTAFIKSLSPHKLSSK